MLKKESNQEVDVASLLEEYNLSLRSLAIINEINELDKDVIKDALVEKHDWTDKGAEHLYFLATNYGSFMLRNALALAIALKIDDGELNL